MVIQRFGTKTTFGVSGSNKFNTEICVIRHITLVQWIAGEGLIVKNSWVAVVMGVVGIKGNCCSGFTILRNANNVRGVGV